MSLAELQRRAQAAERELFNLGITFTVYSERDAIDRILPFDVIPRVLSAADWRDDRDRRQAAGAARSTCSCTTSITTRRS